MKDWNAYHFVGDTLRDGSPVPENGVTLYHTGPLEMCASGFHASRKIWQALEYAPGDTLCRVRCGGEVIQDHDKLVCTERTIIARIDASRLLRDYARACARDVLHLWDAPDVMRQYLKTGDEALRRAARDAAWAAARDAGWAAAWAAARDAAWDAACTAAWAASQDAGQDAARSVARDDAWDADRAAAWGDARAAARAAALKTQRIRLTRMVNAAFSEET